MLTALLIFFALLQAADGWSTVRSLARGDTREANPLLAWLMARIGVVPTLVLFKSAIVVAVAFVALEIAPGVAAAILLAAICAIYTVVVWHNLKLASR